MLNLVASLRDEAVSESESCHEAGEDQARRPDAVTEGEAGLAEPQRFEEERCYSGGEHDGRDHQGHRHRECLLPTDSTRRRVAWYPSPSQRPNRGRSLVTVSRRASESAAGDPARGEDGFQRT